MFDNFKVKTELIFPVIIIKALQDECTWFAAYHRLEVLSECSNPKFSKPTKLLNYQYQQGNKIKLRDTNKKMYILKEAKWVNFGAGINGPGLSGTGISG